MNFNKAHITNMLKGGRNSKNRYPNVCFYFRSQLKGGASQAAESFSTSDTVSVTDFCVENWRVLVEAFELEIISSDPNLVLLARVDFSVVEFERWFDLKNLNFKQLKSSDAWNKRIMFITSDISAAVVNYSLNCLPSDDFFLYLWLPNEENKNNHTL